MKEGDPSVINLKRASDKGELSAKLLENQKAVFSYRKSKSPSALKRIQFLRHVTPTSNSQIIPCDFGKWAHFHGVCPHLHPSRSSSTGSKFFFYLANIAPKWRVKSFLWF